MVHDETDDKINVNKYDQDVKREQSVSLSILILQSEGLLNGKEIGALEERFEYWAENNYVAKKRCSFCDGIRKVIHI